MRRVAALFLPDWPIERLWLAEPALAPQPDSHPSAPPPDRAAGAAPIQGWRPGARWARVEPTRPASPAARRAQGRRSEAADHPFKRLKGDDAAPPRSPAAPHADAAPPAALLVTAERIGNRIVVAAASPAARAIGIVPGISVTSARAAHPSLIVRDADRAGDAAALLGLAQLLARRWSPGVMVADSHCVLIDLSGVAHLFGGEARMLRRLVARLARAGFAARIAAADTIGAAHALSRHAPDRVTICPPGAQAAAIAALPPAALRLDAVQRDLLKPLGIDTIGQLAAMTRAPLARRFGASLVRQLDRALGTAAEPLEPIVPPAPIAVEQRFAEPIATPEAIAHWLAALVARLAQALAEAGLGARRVELFAERVDHRPQRLLIGLARPSRDPAHLLRLLTRRIETIEPAYGIDAMALAVRAADPLGPEALGETLGDARPDLAPLIDTLATLGARTWRERPVESDVPERSVASAPPIADDRRTAPPLRPDDVRRLDLRPRDHPWHPRWPRPVRLLRRPERLDGVLALMPDGAPRRFVWRGQAHVVLRADGPERIAGEWWTRPGERQAVRDYFCVEDDAGARFWLYRRGDGERAATGDRTWFLHGWFG